MALTQEQLNRLYESTVVSDDGETLGRVGHIYLDDHTQQLSWVTFKSGLFGTKETFAPLQGARISEDMIRVRYTKDYIGDAPNISSDGHINEEEQAELYRYYRLDRPVGDSPPGAPVADEAGQQHAASGPVVAEPGHPQAPAEPGHPQAPAEPGHPQAPAEPGDPPAPHDWEDPAAEAEPAPQPPLPADQTGSADAPHTADTTDTATRPDHALEADSDVDEHGHLGPDERKR